MEIDYTKQTVRVTVGKVQNREDLTPLHLEYIESILIGNGTESRLAHKQQLDHTKQADYKRIKKIKADLREIYSVITNGQLILALVLDGVIEIE